MGTKYSALIQSCAKKQAKGRWQAVAVTTAQGNANKLELVDTTNLQDARSNADATLYKNKWVRIIISATENIRKVSSHTVASGILVPLSTFSAQCPTATTYEIHEFHPQFIKDAINEALENMTYEEVLPLTLVEDGDMEHATPINYWAETNITDPVVVNTTIVQFGKQSLEVEDNGSGGGYASLVSTKYIAVTPGQQVIVWAVAYGDQQGAKLTLYDVTNSAVIDTARHDEEGWGLLAFVVNVPDDCYELDVRLETITASGKTYWDHVGILKTSDVIRERPSWLAKEQDFLELLSLPIAGSMRSDNADNAYRMWTRNFIEESVGERIATPRGVVPLRLSLTHRPVRPLFVKGLCPYPELSVDADETEADEQTVIAGAMHYFYKAQGDDYREDAWTWGSEFARRKRGVEGRPIVRMISPYGT